MPLSRRRELVPGKRLRDEVGGGRGRRPARVGDVRGRPRGRPRDAPRDVPGDVRESREPRVDEVRAVRVRRRRVIVRRVRRGVRVIRVRRVFARHVVRVPRQSRNVWMPSLVVLRIPRRRECVLVPRRAVRSVRSVRFVRTNVVRPASGKKRLRSERSERAFRPRVRPRVHARDVCPGDVPGRRVDREGLRRDDSRAPHASLSRAHVLHGSRRFGDGGFGASKRDEAVRLARFQLPFGLNLDVRSCQVL